MILKGHMGAIPSENQDDDEDEDEEDTNSIDREMVGTHEKEEEEALERKEVEDVNPFHHG